MRTLFMTGTLALLLCLLVGCSEKATGPGQAGNIELTAQLETRAFAEQVDQLWLTVSAPDMETIEKIQFLQEGGAEFRFDVPVGRSRTFLLQAVEVPPTGGEPREIYRGSTVVDILPDVVNPVTIRMLPSVPMVRLNPISYEGASGSNIRLELQVFNLDQLQDLRVQFTYDNNVMNPAEANPAPWLAAGTNFESGRANLDLYAYEVHLFNSARPFVSPDNPTVAEVIFTTSATTVGSFTTIPFYGVQAYAADSVLIPDSSIYKEITEITLLPLANRQLTFADATLGDFIARTLGINPPITLDTALSLDYLDATEIGFSDLTGMENLLNLRWLYMSYNSVSDVSPLTGLRNLRQLEMDVNLANNTTVGQISLITYLEGLSLNYNSITDITPLRTLTNLGSLSLSNNNVADISALTGLTELYSINLDSNAITNIQPLVLNSGLGGFDNVSLVGNPLDDISVNQYIPQLIERGVIVNY